MDSMRSLNTSLPGASAAAKQPTQNDSPEQLIDAFKAAALSVTKLYKTSAAAQSKARMDGYQDCLDDLLSFLDNERIGLGDGDGWRIRSWATERLDGARDAGSQNAESDDEADKAETASSPELNRTSSSTQLSSQLRTDSAPPSIPQPIEEEEQEGREPISVTVPTADSFTFQSSHPWPPQPQQQDAYLNLANLDLSDSRTHDASSTTTNPATRTARPRHPANMPRSASRQGSNLGRGAGSKRKINFAEIFDLSSLDKNMFGGGPKRSRHT
ncbi:hypothetical protein CPAR01_03634 [Colletotrichum paranaense]|uniref:Uncharacterized protein n=6 Tax=Colletotrichum acutatum species complex TaxID=2707335 RepID=A0A9Q0B1J0_9PEZI|nr:uncharacterized protein CLUP02_10221 [Colletotrichum lupini]XP_060313206.1 uncharacterized protein CCOS01_08771 [Colletotrichum costaricense]XP_060352127.1 uncharacterized protein CPAR01_03634 [Colletotrichum paranaense]XP_060398129.1 uncharacterized protein CABS01_01560 [Colletotrichum abscissum]KAK0377711.1 hypothetical protein CLIM01_04922 [Colletotrichum limetticola]KAK1469375.1 hypothetical protein CMEL01_01142 [Colletotrichum melonis]KAI3548232.1 hypothetical protein CABS02_08350 [Co